MTRLDGKVAVVCGGSRGLGLAVARALASKGCTVALCARTQSDVDAACTEIARAQEAVVYGETCDLRHRDEVERFLANVTTRLGPIDVLVANAATISVAPIETLDAGDFEDAWRDIFLTALHPAMAVLPSMRERRRGTVAFVTSIGGKIGVPHLAPYSSAKFAEVGFAQALRAEVAKDGIHVLTVVPGLMRTGSPTHAQFGGQASKEYAWFTASANTPLLSIDADRAAKLIVRGIERGAHEVTYTPAARVASRLHDVTPSLFDLFLGIAARLLPRARGRRRPKLEGRDVETASHSLVIDAIERRNRPFAARFGQSRST
jgi:NAD(P)-dependent dehydrogenase (short-subunit alcohol dehydrogenase family)